MGRRSKSSQLITIIAMAVLIFVLAAAHYPALLAIAAIIVIVIFIIKRNPTKKEFNEDNIFSPNYTPKAEPNKDAITVSMSMSQEPAEVIPLATRIKTAIPSKQGLFPHELLALDYAPTFYSDAETDSFQNFWYYYGVNDVKALLSSLLKKGYLRIGELSDALENETMVTLKRTLKNHELKTSGKKEDLVKRIIEEVPHDKLNDIYPRRPYRLTDLGKEALADGDYISYIHRNQFEDLNIWTLNKLVHSGQPKPYREKILEYLYERGSKHLSEDNYGLYILCLLGISKLLMEENKMESALEVLAKEVFYDLSGLENNYDPKFLSISSLFPYDRSFAKISDHTTDRIERCQKELGYSDEELKSFLIKQISSLKAPLQIFTAEECVQIVFWEREQNIKALNGLYNKAKESFKQRYPNIKSRSY